MIKKFAEFNFKLLHNIVPSGYILSKWNNSVCMKCAFCDDIETTEHMLYSCKRICALWEKISSVLNLKVTWKVLVCGFIQKHHSKKIDFINMILSCIVYSIFKKNSNSKFENKNYKDIDMIQVVKLDLCYYKQLLRCTNYGIYSNVIFDSVINIL